MSYLVVEGELQRSESSPEWAAYHASLLIVGVATVAIVTAPLYLLGLPLAVPMIGVFALVERLFARLAKVVAAPPASKTVTPLIYAFFTLAVALFFRVESNGYFKILFLGGLALTLAVYRIFGRRCHLMLVPVAGALLLSWTAADDIENPFPLFDVWRRLGLSRALSDACTNPWGWRLLSSITLGLAALVTSYVDWRRAKADADTPPDSPALARGAASALPASVPDPSPRLGGGGVRGEAGRGPGRGRRRG